MLDLIWEISIFRHKDVFLMLYVMLHYDSMLLCVRKRVFHCNIVKILYIYI